MRRKWDRLVVITVILFAPAALARAQAPSTLGWTGWARCQLTVQGPGYSDQQTHTWMLAGSPPTVEGAFRVYAATWTVVGRGSLQRTQGTQTLRAEWATNGPATSAPIAVFVRASDGRMLIQARHAQLRAAGAIQGYQQLTIDGMPQTPGAIAVEAFEWAFPLIEVPSMGNTATGSTSQAVNGSVGPMQPAGSQATAACTWQFGQGAAAAAPPAPLAAQAIPTPPVPGAVTPPPSAPSAAAAPAAPAAPVTAAPPAAAPTGPPAVAALRPAAPTSQPATAAPPPAATSTIPPAPAATPPAAAAIPPAPPATPPPPTPPAATAPNTPVTARPGFSTGGGLTAAPIPAAVTPETARDPANFSARQTADGTVVLTWDAVAGAASYIVGGPATNVGVTVNGTSHTLTGLPQGQHTWTVATMYNPEGILTTSDRWSRATATVTNASGRYRVVLTGFRVFRPTLDEQINGNGDEVYAAVGVMAIDRRSDALLQSWRTIKSDSYGDVGRNPGYVRAGSMTPTGGLTAGDAVPAGTNPVLTTGTPSSTRFPLLVWEGILRDGIDVVVVKPTLWEIDGQVEHYNEWVDPAAGGRAHPTLAAEQTAAVRARTEHGDLTPFRGVPVFSCSSVECKPGNDRPIGVTGTACNGVRSGVGWCDVTVVFTREGIERALSSPSPVQGIPAGLISISLIDRRSADERSGGVDGEYTLFLRVERAP
jgi:hypothetical protein